MEQNNVSYHITQAMQEVIEKITIDDIPIENIHLVNDSDDIIIVPYIFETPANIVKKHFPNTELMEETFFEFMCMRCVDNQVFTMTLGEFYIEYPEISNKNWSIVVNSG